ATARAGSACCAAAAGGQGRRRGQRASIGSSRRNAKTKSARLIRPCLQSAIYSCRRHSLIESLGIAALFLRRVVFVADALVERRRRVLHAADDVAQALVVVGILIVVGVLVVVCVSVSHGADAGRRHVEL